MLTHWNDYTEHLISRLTSSLKRKRVELFIEALNLNRRSLLLDLGSEDGSYLGSFYPWPERITLADIEVASMKRGVEQYGFMGFIELTPFAKLPFADQSFDVVWCNSVIEHVTVERERIEKIVDHSFECIAERRQQFFAQEIARVGRHYFVQTPNIHFLIESHSWLPLVGYLPQPCRARLGHWSKRFWIKPFRADYYLYDRDRFQRHFPDAEIRIERFAGLPKSLIAIR